MIEFLSRRPYAVHLLFASALLSLLAGLGYGYFSARSESVAQAKDVSSTRPLELYNSGVSRFSDSDLESSEEYYLRVLDLEPLGELAVKSFFNLGYLYAVKAETEVSSDNLQSQLELLQKSKKAFKGMLSLTHESELAEDAKTNLAIVQKRLSKVRSLLKEKELNGLKEKSEYELLTDIEKSQGEIKKLIDRLKNEKDPLLRLEIREELSALRTANYDFLREIYLRLNMDFEEESFGIHGYSI